MWPFPPTADGWPPAAGKASSISGRRRRGRKSKLQRSKQKADNYRDSTDNNTLKLWNVVSGNELITIAGQEYEGFYFKPVALSLNGERIAAGSLDGIDGKITIYDIASPEEVEAELLAEEEGRSWIRSDISE